MNDVLKQLYARAPAGMKLGLDVMRSACAQFGHPERSFEVAHIAGTNGKGSVAAMLESMARRAGRRTGLYTSPHLSRFAERIRIDGEPIGDELLIPILGDVMAKCPELTFFEIATLCAFLAFRDAKVDLAVIEVGLGGRLDATNVIPSPRVTAVTHIALDHESRLGRDVASIAREKAAIAKPQVDLIVGAVDAHVAAAIAAEAHARGGMMSFAEHDVDALAIAQSVTLPLAGRHQVRNATVAAALGRRLGIGAESIRAGLESVRWPGRLETVSTPEGDILLDAAHNPDGAEALAAYLRSAAFRWSSRALVFGTFDDKDWHTMISSLAPFFSHRFYVSPLGRAATHPQAIATAFPGNTPPTTAEAIASARKAAGPHGVVVVTGSISLVGEVRGRLLGLKNDPSVAL